jgi:hypothetical protein
MGGLGHSAATSLPCLASLGHLTADKREIKDFPKLPSATSFIRKTLYAIEFTKEIRYGTINYSGKVKGSCTCSSWN